TLPYFPPRLSSRNGSPQARDDHRVPAPGRPDDRHEPPRSPEHPALGRVPEQARPRRPPAWWRSWAGLLLGPDRVLPLLRVLQRLLRVLRGHHLLPVRDVLLDYGAPSTSLPTHTL
ncbi:uncharacterized protein TRAVEDRAFT_166569, partial [Trametes versicolor FP-101664 SS1]|uniref:uncharacterized protein n=1 Tax=Trametes versicolor (strain FP-101664) TaxID=717944 RepID=UPI0004623AC9